MTRRKRYWTLFVNSNDGAGWRIEFGDYDRGVCVVEAKTYRDEGDLVEIEETGTTLGRQQQHQNDLNVRDAKAGRLERRKHENRYLRSQFDTDLEETAKKLRALVHEAQQAVGMKPSDEGDWHCPECGSCIDEGLTNCIECGFVREGKNRYNESVGLDEDAMIG